MRGWGVRWGWVGRGGEGGGGRLSSMGGWVVGGWRVGGGGGLGCKGLRGGGDGRGDVGRVGVVRGRVRSQREVV